MGALLSLSLLGGFRFADGAGRPVTISARKGQALLAYLACAPGGEAPREALAALLWQDRDSARARQNLRQVLFGLSRQFAAGWVAPLRARGPVVALDHAVVQVDVGQFERLAAEGTDAALERALALYRGAFLADFAVSAPSFEDWLAATRARYHDMALKGLARLMKQHGRAGRIGRAIATGAQALALDPCREDIRRAVMRLYLEKGMRAEALRQYQACCEVLARELDAPPDAETVALYRKILRYAAPAESTPPVAPASDISMIGRADARLSLERHYGAVLDGACRLVAITGEAGVGKTHLVEAFAAAARGWGATVLTARARPAERALAFVPWTDLLAPDGAAPGRHAGPRSDLASRLAAWCTVDAGQAHASRSQGIFRAAVQEFRDRARDAPLLVVLEDFQWADDWSWRLLAYAAPRLRDARVMLVVTVRADEPRPTGHADDYLAMLDRDGLIYCLPLEPLSRAETRELARRAHAARGRAVRTDLRLGALWSLSEGNPGIVLALLGGAGRPGAGAAGGPLEALRRQMVRALARQGEDARALVCMASVLGGRGTFAVARRAAGLGETAGAVALEDLVEAGLLQAHGETLRFRRRRERAAVYDTILGPTRAVMHRRAAGALLCDGESGIEIHGAAIIRHYRKAGHMRAVVDCEIRWAEVALDRGSPLPARRGFERALAAADKLALGEVDENAAPRARLGLAEIALLEAAPDRAVAALGPLAEADGRDARPAVRVMALAMLSRAALMERREAEGYRRARRALARAERSGDDRLWITAERLMRRLTLMNGGYGAALNAALRARDRARRLGLHRSQADASAALAVLRMAMGDCEQAATEAEAGVRAARRVRDGRMIAACLQISSLLLTAVGAHDRALAALDRARELARAAGDVARLYALMGHRGRVLSGAMRHGEAAAQLGRAIDDGGRLGTGFYQPLFMAWHAEALARAGQDGAALRQGRRGARLAGAANLGWPRAIALRAAARALTSASRPPRAARFALADRLARDAVATHRRLGLPLEEVQSLGVWAHVRRVSGDMSRANALVQRAAELRRAAGMAV